MKSILVFFLTLGLTTAASAREINPRGLPGGIKSKNLDPHENMNKSGHSKRDMDEAARILCETGYGPCLRKIPKTQNGQNSRTQGRN